MDHHADMGKHLNQEDDEGLWDELSMQQSKEIQQHHRRISMSSNRNSSAVAAAAIRDAIQKTTEVLSSALSSTASTPTSTKKFINTTASDPHRRNQMSLAEFGLDTSNHSNSQLHSSHQSANFPSHPLEKYHKNSIPPPPPPPLTPSSPNTSNNGVNNIDTTAKAPLLAHDFQDNTDLEAAHLPEEPSSTSHRQSHGGGMDFVFLRKFRLIPKSEGWGAVPDLDLFFTSIYNYYYHRGITVIIGKGIVEIISLFFTLLLSIFLIGYVDWRALTTCQDASSCRGELSDYMVEKSSDSLSLWNFYIVLYCMIFTCYGLFKIFSFLVTAQDAAEAKAFYEEKLGISQRELEGGSIEWDFIVQKVIKLQESGEHRIAIHGESLDALVVAHRILRKENFLVAFLNNDLLDLRVPLPWPLSSSGRSKQQYFSKSLEWSLHLCIFSHMFNHKFQIRPDFCMNPSALKRRLLLCGIAQALFMPFLLIFMVLHFFFLNVHDWQSSQQYLGPKEWSNIAKWTFREFNELPHAFERRLAPSHESAEDYLKLFTKSPVMICLGQVVVFLSGSILAVLLAFATINDSILLHVQLAQWNLLWYVGIFGGIFSAGRSLLPDTKTQRVIHRNLFLEMDTALAKVSLSTHYLPDKWRGRGWEKTTQNQFSQMYQVKAQLFVMELLSVILSPFILMISLPKCASDICLFVQKIKIDVPGVGQVCGFSAFDFNSFEDENWVGKEINSSNNRMKSSLHSIRSRPKTRHGKMEKSFFSFKTSHPSWKCNLSAQNLVDRVEKYQLEQTRAMLARERHHRIEAANRELETLLLLERASNDTGLVANNNGKISLNEAYIAKFIEEGPSGKTSDSDEESDTKGTVTSNSSKVNGFVSKNANTNADTKFIADSEIDKQSIFSMNGTLQSGTDLSLFNKSTIPSITKANKADDISVLHYADTALSTELRRVLDKSMLELGGMSAMKSTFGRALNPISSITDSLSLAHDNNYGVTDHGTEFDKNIELERKHFWLEKYHSQMKD